MFRILNQPRRAVLALALVLLPAGALATIGDAGASAGPLRCEIRAVPSGGMVALEALARSDRSVGGSYAFQVTSAGRGGGTDIHQGGAFRAAAGETARLGRVTLGADGAVYDATLDVTVGGRTISCTERVGGAL
ncbi:hypothetical protein GCM10011390_38260 [Aureimonas endophytica]|uniref:CsgH-like domain-containing protein n=1 Tax=Aureimonas endophytica TaxID=2027858 RepID=A0A916ZV20_9HYPH|nr:curli-like amyloid fiber formation chaperone CsgH [Aureimonas endophytica]GGE15487.1 hypothetical protein GCM10011390_38260 [Aureimonas endophytica]